MTTEPINQDELDKVRLRVEGVEPSRTASLVVLAHLANLEAPITVPELARLTGIHRASLYRTVESLTAEGWLVSEGQPRRYVLSLRLAQLGLRALRHHPVRQSLLPFATKLTLELGTPTNISFYEDGFVVVTDSLAVQNGIAVSFPEGVRIPVTANGAGKALLAFQPQAEIGRVLSRPLTRYTQRTQTDPAEVLRELELVRERGYGWAFGEYGSRLGTTGLPVRDRSGAVVAAIGFIVGRKFEGPPSEWLDAAHRVCDAASSQLGYRSTYIHD